MPRVLRILLAFTISMGVACASLAQSPGQVTQGPGNTGGILWASNFGQWAVPQGNTGQFSWSSPLQCNATASGIPLNLVFKVGTPITIKDQVPANTEIVTPSAVYISGSGCSITVSPVNKHNTFALISATAGLQEAINYAACLPYMVILTPDWTRLGGTTAMITAAMGCTVVSILDQRTSTPVAYTWNGSSYVITSLPAACVVSGVIGIPCGGTGSPTAAGANLNITGVTQTGTLGTSSQVSTFPGTVDFTGTVTTPSITDTGSLVTITSPEILSQISSTLGTTALRRTTEKGTPTVFNSSGTDLAVAYRNMATQISCTPGTPFGTLFFQMRNSTATPWSNPWGLIIGHPFADVGSGGNLPNGTPLDSPGFSINTNTIGMAGTSYTAPMQPLSGGGLMDPLGHSTLTSMPIGMVPWNCPASGLAWVDLEFPLLPTGGTAVLNSATSGGYGAYCTGNAQTGGCSSSANWTQTATPFWLILVTQSQVADQSFGDYSTATKCISSAGEGCSGVTSVGDGEDGTSTSGPGGAWVSKHSFGSLAVTYDGLYAEEITNLSNGGGIESFQFGTPGYNTAAYGFWQSRAGNNGVNTNINPDVFIEDTTRYPGTIPGSWGSGTQPTAAVVLAAITLTQATSGATVQLVENNTTNLTYTTAITGTPDTSHTWTAAGYSATYTPSGFVWPESSPDLIRGTFGGNIDFEFNPGLIKGSSQSTLTINQQYVSGSTTENLKFSDPNGVYFAAGPSVGVIAPYGVNIGSTVLVTSVIGTDANFATAGASAYWAAPGNLVVVDASGGLVASSTSSTASGATVYGSPTATHCVEWYGAGQVTDCGWVAVQANYQMFGGCYGTMKSSTVAPTSFAYLGTSFSATNCASGALAGSTTSWWPPQIGAIYLLHVHLGTTPAVGETLTFTVYKNGVAGAVTCPITNPGLDCVDSAHTVSISTVGTDYISVQQTVNTNSSETAANPFIELMVHPAS